ncbi:MULTISPECIES: hypothetical protein [Streptomyces]|nr:hypothetical protein [Streptomyces sp. NEAU-HV9]
MRVQDRDRLDVGCIEQWQLTP